MNELSAPRTSSLRDHWQLLPLLGLATLLRLWQINESLWLDELHSAWVVSAGVGDVLERAQMGNQSPLYFYLPWATTALLGMSEWSLRLPSLVAGVGLVAMAYGLAYQFTRSRIAAGACATLVALDHNFLFYATETRPYACVQLVAAFQLLVFWRLQDATSVRRRAIFVASTVLLFYLHYTAILLVAGETLFLLTRSFICRQQSSSTEYKCRQHVIDLICIAALTIPTAAHLLDIGSRRDTWTTFINDTSLLLPIYWFSFVSYVAVPVFAVLGTIVAITRRRDEPLNRSVLRLGSSRRSVMATLLLACWLGVPLVIVWLLTVTRIAPLYLGRYVIGAALAPVGFASLCVGFQQSTRSQLTTAALIITYAFLASGMIEQLRYDGRLFGDRTENWRDAVRYVNEGSDLARDSPVFVRSGLLEADRLIGDDSEALRRYCVSPVTSIYRIERLDNEIRPLTTRDAGKLTDENLNQIEASGSAWFIINGTTGTRKRCSEQVVNSLEKEIDRATYTAIQRGLVLYEEQFGHVGVFYVELWEIDDQVTPLDDQPTSPSSIAPP